VDGSNGSCIVTKSNVSSGLKVVRGPDWKWEDQDGGIGTIDVLQASSVDPNGWSGVKWGDGSSSENKCRVTVAADLKFHKSACLCGGSNALSIGDRVRVKKSVPEPEYKWGSDVSHESIGILKKIESDGDVVIDFPERSGWKGVLTEMERAPAGTETKNSNGDLVAKGGKKGGTGGYTGLDPSKIWYCGKHKV
jgi:hypothetical protein